MERFPKLALLSSAVAQCAWPRVLCVVLGLVAATLGGGAAAPVHGHLMLIGGGPTPAPVFTRALELAGGRAARVAVLPHTYPNDSMGDTAVELWKQFGVRDVVRVSRSDSDAARAALERA